MTSEGERRELDTAIRRVVQRNACIGCGLCTRLDTSLRMELEPDGFLRPHLDRRRRGRRRRRRAPLRAGVPRMPRGGRASTREPAASDHGPYFGVWEAWANDEAVRWRGSSGGALTAVHGWLLDSGLSSRIASASIGAEPRRTVPVTITTKAEALAAAGSRYAPVGISQPDLGSAGAITAKPCEIAAIRALGSSGRPDGVSQGDNAEADPILLSFFCAGTLSQRATDELLVMLGVGPDESLDDLWYRGRGWPGRPHAAPRGRRRLVELRGVSGRCPRAGDALALQKGVRRRRGRVRRCRRGRLLEGGRERVPVFTEGPGSSALIAARGAASTSSSPPRPRG